MFADVRADSSELSAARSDRKEQIECSEIPIKSAIVRNVAIQLQRETDLVEYWNNPLNLTSLEVEIKQLQGDGLQPEHYQADLVSQLRAGIREGHQLAGCDAEKVTAAYVSALKDLFYGRVDPVEYKLVWYAESVLPSTAALLGLAQRGLARGVGSAFSEARPQLSEYQQLRAHYLWALNALPSQWVRVPEGSLLSAGDVNPRVKFIRERLRQGGFFQKQPTEVPGSDYFSPALGEAVIAFQRAHGLQDDGVIGRNTIREMNVQPATRLAQLRVNLERLRWYARDYEASMVLVDIAGAKVHFWLDGVERYSGRAQAGLPARKTPALKSKISHITLNPTWTVPPTILRNDVLPAVRRDLSYLQSNHIRVFNVAGKELDPAKIDWTHPGAVVLRQDAGPHGALGRVALRFANPFSVYLHDTPNKKLFATSSRFYSSGCVRVENAETLSDQLFENAPKVVLEEIDRARLSGLTKNISLATRISLLMVYWTVAVEKGGAISFRSDVYGRDARLLQVLSER